LIEMLIAMHPAFAFRMRPKVLLLALKVKLWLGMACRPMDWGI
jgi:hypothetical protein